MDRDGAAIVEPLIITARGKRVIAASDLAKLYGVQPRALNQAVKRNKRRFPADFAFQMTPDESREFTRSRSQSVILKRGANPKYQPLMFTEHGAIMAATVLKSRRAERMSIFVVRAFLRLREWAAAQTELGARLVELEKHVKTLDEELATVIMTIRRMISPPAAPPRRIGFTATAAAPRRGLPAKRRRAR